MATCNECIHFVDCCNDECTRYYSTIVACDKVEKRCNFFKNKADVVEVVRCKDCKYYRQNEYSPDEDMMCMCWCDWLPTDPDDFCSYGERKTD